MGNHREVGQQGEGRRTPGQPLEIPPQRPCVGDRGEAPPGEEQKGGATEIANHMADMAEEGPVEAGLVAVGEALNLIPGIRMATHRALAENHQRPGEDVGALHRD